jgi:hypothetical protein
LYPFARTFEAGSIAEKNEVRPTEALKMARPRVIQFADSSPVIAGRDDFA